MKKMFLFVVAFLMALGLLGCNEKESYIEFQDFVNDCNTYIDDEIIASSFSLTGTEAGYIFKYENISGTMDKEKHIKSIKIVCEGVKTAWIRTEPAAYKFLADYLNVDNSITWGQLKYYVNTYDVFSAIKAIYQTVSKKTASIEATVDILTSSEPVQIANWIVTVDVKESNETVTITAKVN